MCTACCMSITSTQITCICIILKAKINHNIANCIKIKNKITVEYLYLKQNKYTHLYIYTENDHNAVKDVGKHFVLNMFSPM